MTGKAVREKDEEEGETKLGEMQVLSSSRQLMKMSGRQGTVRARSMTS